MLIPAEMTHNPSTPHVFAIDNPHWMNMTLEGGSFHATSAIIIEQQDTEHQPSTVSVPSGLPGFPAFCAHLCPEHISSKIAYHPLIPSSPTDPAVLKEEMTRIATTSATLGNKYTMITGDQATYALALAIRNKDEHMFCNMILLYGVSTRLTTT